MRSKSPWWWIPTLYFAEGIPYFIVNVISVTMFKRLGMPNGSLAMYTSLLYLPWVIKPLWSPFIDIIRSKRWWILATQLTMTAGFAALALSVSPDFFGAALCVFYIIAFASATHDIAADGFYMLALDKREQSGFVGIRSTFYRIASVFGQGVIVVVAGMLENSCNSIPAAWKLTLAGTAVLFGAISLWHVRTLPSPEAEDQPDRDSRELVLDFARAWTSFFKKPGIWTALAFMLMYRLPEALSVKMLSPFLLDSREAGGLGLTTSQSGLVYGTVGVIALTAGGILGGLYAARKGLKKSMWPMSLALALPCAVYLFLAAAGIDSMPVIYACVALDQFGYGFGFTAYLLYMMHFSEGEFKTSHYAICTAFMAMSMMIPGIFAGWLQEAVGYTGFFITVMICCSATIFVTSLAQRRLS